MFSKAEIEIYDLKLDDIIITSPVDWDDEDAAGNDYMNKYPGLN